MRFVRIAICQWRRRLLPPSPVQLFNLRRRVGWLLYERRQIPRLAPLAPFCWQITAIKCQRTPSTPYSQFRVLSSLMPDAVFKCYCKFNNKYKSFSKLTGKARPPAAHRLPHTQVISIFFSFVAIFIFVCLVGPLLGFLTSSVRTRDTCCARQDGRTNGQWHGHP